MKTLPFSCFCEIILFFFCAEDYPRFLSAFHNANSFRLVLVHFGTTSQIRYGPLAYCKSSWALSIFWKLPRIQDFFKKKKSPS